MGGGEGWDETELRFEKEGGGRVVTGHNFFPFWEGISYDIDFWKSFALIFLIFRSVDETY